MSTTAEVWKRARALGCDFEVLRRSPLDCQVLAPQGKRFVDMGLHVLVGHEVHGTKAEAARVCADLLERMSLGVEDCNDPSCDACSESED